MLSPTTILSISVLIDAHGQFEFAISDVGIQKSYTVAITALLRACNFKTCEQTK